MVEFSYEQITKFSITTDLISKWVDDIINLHNKLSGDISIIFCSDEYLLKINSQYLEHNYFTDVITFDYTDSNVVSGDIFISIDRVQENAKTYSISFINELLRVIIHGVLHLLGFNDKSESEKIIMTSKEDECLKLYSDVK